MLNRLIRISLVSAFALAIAGSGVAMAQDEGGGEGDGMEKKDDAKTPEPGGEGGDKAPEPGGEGGDKAKEGDGGGDAAAGDDGGKGMDWKKGALGVNVDLGLNLSDGSEADPISIAPDVWYVISPKLRAILGHSPQSMGGFYGESGYGRSGICVGDACAQAYDNFNVGADYWAVKGDMNVIAWGRVVARSIDGSFFGLSVGANIGKALSGGKLMVGINPNIYLGLTDRDAGNKEILTVPLHAMYALSPKLMLGVQTGIQGPIDGFGDGWRLPLSLGAMFKVNKNISAGAVFNLFALAGADIFPTGADLRALSLMVSWTK